MIAYSPHRPKVINAPKRLMGLLITVNETIINGEDLPAEHWETWGQTDITPFLDNVTTIGELP